MHIRPAAIEDAAALAEIERQAFDTARYSALWGARQFRRAIEGERHICLVACLEDNQVAGYALGLVRATSRLVRFYSLAVAPAAKGRRLGEALFEAMETAARERNYKGVILEIRKDNQFLFDRYTRLGYTTYKEVAQYYPDGCSCLKMKKIFPGDAGTSLD